jgi:mannose-6-phosphate isomerase
MTNTIPLNKPIFFQPNRVWRLYTGGELLDRFVGNPSPKDDHFPEDWLASTTVAVNAVHQQSPTEGISRVRMPDGSDGPLFNEILPEGTNVLCKFLDSAVRLPIQCHPDKEFSRKYYHSEHGKTESWVILATRKINGEEPYLLMGFKPDVDKQKFINAVKEQDIATMENMLHKFPVKPRETYFIPGRFPHAIGSGVMLLEVQEPTDWVIQPERFCAGFELSDADMWGPLDPEIAMECFDYRGETKEEMLERHLMHPKILHQNSAATLESIIGPETTDCFIVERLTINPNSKFTYENTGQHLGIVTSGKGSIGSDIIKQADRFFISEQIKTLHYEAKEQLVIYIIKSPQ